MADNESYRRRTISFFFGSPKLFTGFSAKGFSEMENQMSPTSILDTKPFSCLVNPLWYETKIPKTRPTESRRHWDKLDSNRIGLGIVDDLIDQSFRIVPFGSHLKTQNPSPEYNASENSQTGSFLTELSLSPTKKSAFGSSVSGQEMPVSWAFTECPSSVIEMELCEEYTCVISHGPNPTTTHIFDDCIVESCEGVLHGSTKKTKQGRHESFVNLCFTCKKSPEKGSIYMNRGEQAFCSEECRNQEKSNYSGTISDHHFL